MVEQNVCWHSVPLVLWWRSVFSSPLIDFLKLEWTSEQLKHFMVEFDSRYRLEKHQLCWGFIWRFSWHGYFLFPLDLCWSSSPHQTVFIFLFYRKHSFLPYLWRFWDLFVLLFMVTSISRPISLPNSFLQQSYQEW